MESYGQNGTSVFETICSGMLTFGKYAFQKFNFYDAITRTLLSTLANMCMYTLLKALLLFLKGL